MFPRSTSLAFESNLHFLQHTERRRLFLSGDHYPEFGFSSEETALLQIPSGVIAIIAILTATFLAGRYNQRGIQVRSPPASWYPGWRFDGFPTRRSKSW